MGAHSGKFGVVNGQSTVKSWQISETSATKKIVASNTKGGSKRRRGTRDWSGNFVQYGLVPTLRPGEKFTFEGYTAPGNDVLGANGRTYSGPAIVDSIAIAVNWASNDPITVTVNFSSDGELVKGTGLYEDDSDPTGATAEDVLATYLLAGGSGSAEVDGIDLCLSQFTLTLTAGNVTSINSCTDGQTGRKEGNFDWSASLVVEEDGRPDFDIDDNLEIWLYLNDVMAWHLKWGIVKDFTNLTVDRDSAAIISQTVALEMNGFDDDEGEGVVESSAGEIWPSPA